MTVVACKPYEVQVLSEYSHIFIMTYLWLPHATKGNQVVVTDWNVLPAKLKYLLSGLLPCLWTKVLRSRPQIVPSLMAPLEGAPGPHKWCRSGTSTVPKDTWRISHFIWSIPNFVTFLTEHLQEIKLSVHWNTV